MLTPLPAEQAAANQRTVEALLGAVDDGDLPDWAAKGIEEDPDSVPVWQDMFLRLNRRDPERATRTAWSILDRLEPDFAVNLLGGPPPEKTPLGVLREQADPTRPRLLSAKAETAAGSPPAPPDRTQEPIRTEDSQPQPGASRVAPPTFRDELPEVGPRHDGWRAYLGPHLNNALDSVDALAQGLVSLVGPQADIKDAHDYARKTSESARQGDVAGAVANLGMTAAALGGIFLPGNAGAVDDATKAALKRLDQALGDGARRAVESSGSDAARRANFYDAPPLERPFEADYPHGHQADARGNLTHDIDGRPLDDRGRIAGRRQVGGMDEAIPGRAFDAIAKEGTGQATAISRLGPGTFGETRYYASTKRPALVKIAEGLHPGDRAKVYAHELGHVIDQFAGQIPTKGLTRELRHIYDLGRNPNRDRRGLTYGPKHRPRDDGYDDQQAPRELMAEAIRLYMTNPAYIKEHAPKTAAAIRKAVNTNEELRRIIQFNSLGAGLAAGAGSGLAVAAAGEGRSDPEER